MKNYSRRSSSGKTAYRTPSRVVANQARDLRVRLSRELERKVKVKQLTRDV